MGNIHQSKSPLQLRDWSKWERIGDIPQTQSLSSLGIGQNGKWNREHPRTSAPLRLGDWSEWWIEWRTSPNLSPSLAWGLVRMGNRMGNISQTQSPFQLGDSSEWRTYPKSSPLSSLGIGQHGEWNREHPPNLVPKACETGCMSGTTGCLTPRPLRVWQG